MTVEEVISKYLISSDEYPPAVRGLVILEKIGDLIIAIHPDDLRELDHLISEGRISLEETGLEKYYEKWREEGLIERVG